MSTLSNEDQERINAVSDNLKNVSEDDAKNIDWETAAKKGKKGHLANFFEDIVLLIQLCKDYWNGTYRDVSWTTIATISATLIYIVSPIDVIPDFILGVGLADDAALLALTLSNIKSEINAYKKFRKEHPEIYND